MSQHCLLDSAYWIWLAQADTVPNQYLNLRRVCSLPATPTCATLQLSVDSDFVLYVNGSEAGRGQFSDYPAEKTYSTIDVTPYLHAGDNTLAVLAYYRGRDFSTYRSGQPGLILALEVDGTTAVVSDATWAVRQCPAFQSGEMPVVTIQLGYTICCDARADDGWRQPDYIAGADWTPARVLAAATDGFWQTVSPRPVPPTVLHPEMPVRLVTQGNFRREATAGSIAELMARDALQTRDWRELFDFPMPAENTYQHEPPHVADSLMQPDDAWAMLTPPADGSSGRYLIFDLECEEAGLLALHLEAPAGTVLDLAHGEHLDDGHVRMAVGGRHFADRYICAEGENRYIMPFRRLGARYLQVHLSNFSTPVRLNYLGLRPVHLPVDDCGDFQTHDRLAGHTYAIAKRGLQLCMHEHYEDCPWREQALYAGDARNQALYGYYAFGNYAFAAASFDLLGRGVRDDGVLELCAPARVGVTIPAFSLLWITALAEYWLHSGDSSLFARFAAQIRHMLATGLMHRPDAATGLYRPYNGPDAWPFYDWMDGLAGIGKRDDRLEALYNLYLHEALGSYAWMLQQCGETDAASEIRLAREALGQAIVRTFWDDDAGAFATSIQDGVRTHFADLVQALALHERLVPTEQIPQLVTRLRCRQAYPMTFYTLLYQALALREAGPDARAFMAETITRIWEPMVLAGATSFWETGLGGADFNNAGSLCHGWSSLPVYYYGAYVLGSRPLTPGFTRFTLAPYPDRLYHASGRIPTPAGPITVRWTREHDGLHLEAEGPATLTPVLQPYLEVPVASATYNGIQC